MTERLRVYVKPPIDPDADEGVYVVTVRGPVNGTSYWYDGGFFYASGRGPNPRPGRGQAERRALAWGIGMARRELRELAKL